MKLNDLDSNILEAKVGPGSIAKAEKGIQTLSRFKNWLTGLGKKSDDIADIKKVEPVLDKPRVRMVDGKPMQIMPDGSMKPYTAPSATPKVEPTVSATPTKPSLVGQDVKDFKRSFSDRIKDKISKPEKGTTTVSEPGKVELPKDVNIPPKMRKPKAEPEVAPKAPAEPEVAPTVGPKSSPADEVEPTSIADKIKSGWDTTKTWGKRGAAGYTGLAAADAGITAATDDDASFGKEFVKNVVAPVNIGYKDMSAEPGNDNVNSKGEPIVPASKSASAPGSDDDFVPVAKESILTILKLSGQRPITERDNIMGIVKPKQIVTLNESVDLNECGMGMGGSQTASFSINATAGSGEEVASMLTSILQLAGVRNVGSDMMPQGDVPMPMVKALQILGDEPTVPSEPDSMNAGADAIKLDVASNSEEEAGGSPVTVRNVDTGEEFVGTDVTEPGKITVKNKATGEEFVGREATEEEYSNTPADPTDVPEWDPEKMVFRPNQAHQGDRMDGTMPKGVPAMEDTSLAATLLKEYESFKNGQ